LPESGGRTSILEDEFVGFDSRYWKHTFDIKRQPGRPENVAFIHKGTLFMGLNIIGGEVHDSVQWSTRHTDQVEWTIEQVRLYKALSTKVGRVVIFGHADPNSRHQEFFAPLKAFIKDELQNQIPILYLNGDGHKWLFQPNFYDQPSFLRIMVIGLAVDPLLKVTIAADWKFLDPQKAFLSDRLL
jgi:hypothetical protein